MARSERGQCRGNPLPGAPHPRRGMTLIELLVVIFILTLLLATALPLMKPAVEEGKIRDAARQINAFLAGAKARAAEIGRPVGVWIERIPESNAAVQLYLAETPPMYSGDSLGATALVTLIPSTAVSPPPTNERYIITGPLAGGGGFINSESLLFVLAPNIGDEFRIKFGYKGHFYNCQRMPPASAGTYLFELNRAQAQHVQPVIGVAQPYQVLLNPRRSSAAPLQLAGGAAIDLQYSGIGGFTDNTINPAICPTVGPHVAPPTGLEFWDNRNPTSPANNRQLPLHGPVVIVFRPSGDVERLIYDHTSHFANGTIHLLVGKIEQVETPAEGTTAQPNPIPWSPVDSDTCPHSENLVDTRTIWISIGHRTGLVTSSRNGWNFDPDENTGTPPNFRDCFSSARSFAQNAQMAGGR